MSEWFADGQRISSIAADDRAAQYGDGLFETIAIRDGVPRLWDAHVARLQTGCARLGMICPAVAWLRAQLAAAIAQATEASAMMTAKLVITAGPGPRGYRRSPDSRAIVRIGIFASSLPPAERYREGVDVRLCATRLAVQPQLAGIKSLNRLEQVLARSEWHDTRVFEGLLLDTGGRLICGTMSNVFIAAQSVLMTPAITRCGVSGIMRGHVISLLQAAGIACDVRDLQTDALHAADEVFLTNSQFGVVPVRRCASHGWPVGAITRRAQALAATHGVPECSP
jgi:4-amino-4-deoxychorismate lyase